MRPVYRTQLGGLTQTGSVGSVGDAGTPSHDVSTDRITIVGVTTTALGGIGADRRASAGGARFVTSKRMRKIDPVRSNAAMALAGAVSHLQQLVDRLWAEAALYAERHGTEPHSPRCRH